MNSPLSPAAGAPVPDAPTRTYRMTARARAVEETRGRILDAVLLLHEQRLSADISLADVADEAGVSVQTVLRHFGSREGLIDAAIERATADVEAERRSDPGDVAGAVRAVVEHYERRGDGVLLLLAQEGSEAFAANVTATGRALHRRWVETCFGPLLPRGPARAATVDLLVVATDVYTWKLLRRDRGLSAQSTRTRMETLARAVLAATAPGD
ncbi:MAG TPA: TetR/AcrR family transcriptional regulator [Ornithinibacter sp.]|uniref:TetR/AcrR family transcriptional regulator n=1 Tax=Ornithinibacter sp. TaxID=2862748 RepID=UPI001B749746|nr:TetR/AcrR family transcriptional regulator [Ornithinibacter sp.]MBP6524083.1 TetR/AcrR family transcriptional regulator [Dermatophilaceae bacterium]MBU9943504.1 TetR/AcrR family transcriptional regulator [Dermatophilaceae bacterium]HQV81922.1 TetR/AcrR family transcriptional regulator [Ornithinibacter sp.]HQW73075.1 TetR/AcrR family transcriptional regulator [Ornithinibacter sp.]HQX86681.1 TetR/AcrR family transcriptional regulator [Ornithinibacter sp.]